MDSYGQEYGAPEHWTPAKKDDPNGTDQRLHNFSALMARLKMGRSAHGPEHGTKYNLPTQGG